jgi:cytochrome c-type biogenesis protein CcmH
MMRAATWPQPRGGTPAAPSAGLPAALLLAALLALGWPGTAGWALTERELDEKVQAITDQLRCPTCQAVSVRDSEASFSIQIREKVRRMVLEGQSEEAIKAYFVSRYGEWILRAPKKEGLGLVLWLLPGVGMLAAAGLIGWRVYRNSRAPSTSRQPTLTPEQQDRIARDLRRFEEED